MNNVFEPLFQYGFHDTEFSSIEIDGTEIKLHFDKGIYLLDETGNETQLSKSAIVALKVALQPFIEQVEQQIEIKIVDEKCGDLEYSDLKKDLKKEPFEVFAVYFSPFNNTVLFTGSIGNKSVDLSIEGVQNIQVLFKLE